jgi:hypothetical protein
MRFEFGALPWELLGRRPVMITLTYPREWEVWVPDAPTFVKHREAFRSRWERKFGTPVGVWVAEFQRRGAPHLHLYVGLPDQVSEAEYIGYQKRTVRRRVLQEQVGSYEARRRLRAPSGEFAMWLRTIWWEIVGSELAAHHGRGVDIATAFYNEQAASNANRTKVADYFWRESGKWAQKNAPEGFGPMKYYGRWGGKKTGFVPIVDKATLGEGAFYEARRVLRRLHEHKLRAIALKTGRRFNKKAGRSRGRDGLTVFDVNGASIGPRLRVWAEAEALRKMTAVPATDESELRRFSPVLLRALPELVIDTDVPPGPPEQGDPPEWAFREVDPEDLWVEQQQRLDDLEARAEAAANRELRKRALRAADPRRRRP